MYKSMSNFYTIDEIAEILAVSRYTVYSWTNRGTLPSFKLNGLVRVNKDEFGEWLDSKKRKVLRKQYVSLNPEVFEKLRVAAHRKKMSVRYLVNLMLGISDFKKME